MKDSLKSIFIILLFIASSPNYAQEKNKSPVAPGMSETYHLRLGLDNSVRLCVSLIDTAVLYATNDMQTEATQKFQEFLDAKEKSESELLALYKSVESSNASPSLKAAARSAYLAGIVYLDALEDAKSPAQIRQTEVGQAAVDYKRAIRELELY